MYNIVKVVVSMDMIYYVILGVTVVSYLLGLFLSFFEKRGQISVLSSMGNVGFINVFGVNVDPPKPIYQQDPAMVHFEVPREEPVIIQSETVMECPKKSIYMDDEII